MEMRVAIFVSRHGQFIKDFLDDRFAGFFLGLGLVGDGDAMAQHVHADAFHVLRRHVATAFQERISLGRQRQRDGRARRRAKLDEILHRDLVMIGIARGADQIHDVILHLVVHVNVVDDFACFQDLLRRDDGAATRLAARFRHRLQNLPLVRARRITDFQFQHETIHLRFGQRISSFLFNRILRRQNEKRFFKLERIFTNRDLFLLHRFEQCALHLRGRAIDFIGEDKVGEDGAFARGEAAGLRIVNLRADDVGGQHVRRELQARKFHAQTICQRFDRERFGQARHAFEQDVAIGQQPDDQSLGEITLPDDDFAKFVKQRVREGARLFDPLR